MNLKEHLLTVLCEECAEVQQAASKALRFGIKDSRPGTDSTNAQDIEKEFIEAMAVRDILVPKRANTARVFKVFNESICPLYTLVSNRGYC